MQHVLRCWERQSDGWLRIQENPSAAGVPPRTPLRELTVHPQTLIGGGEGLAVPSPKTPPRSQPFGRRLSYPHSKISSDALENRT